MKKLVIIGGGVGVPTVLAGLKDKGVDITAIITVLDNGRNSGVLRRELGVLPPADIKNALLALSDASEGLRQVFSYRFTKGYLDGTHMSNLLIASLSEIQHSFLTAVQEASKILQVRGTVLPCTLQNATLLARLADGTVVRGEHEIKSPRESRAPIEEVFTEPSNLKTIPEVINALNLADLIVLGPGGLYNSVIVNLLVGDLRDAIVRSSAKKAFIANIMTQPHTTEGYALSDHVREIEKYLGKGVLDYVLVNTKHLSEEVIEEFRKESAEPVRIDKENLEGIKIIEGDFVNEEVKHKWHELGLLRHDAEKIVQALLRLA
ncbi:MAG: YvcK family protein [Parcubacteria group bacterium]|nr:YvcK family protein [Parcubacteria group bacterium]